MNTSTQNTTPDTYVRIVPLSGGGRIGRSLTYSVPPEFVQDVSIGSVVAIEVRKTLRIGVVTAFDSPENFEASPFKIKKIHSVYTDEVLLRESDIKIARWIASYYACSPGDALSPMAPEVRALQVVTMLEASDPAALMNAIDALSLLFARPDMIKIEERDDGSARIARKDLIEAVRSGGLSESKADSTIESWVKSGILTQTAVIRTRIRHIGQGSFLTLSESALDSDWSKLRSGKQKLILELLNKVGGILSREEIIREISSAQAGLRALLKKGFIEEIVDSSLLPDNSPGAPEFELIKPQIDAVDTVVKSMHSGKPGTFLLYGVTGSGKTEVYMDICRKALEIGKRATILVPEIALTYQTVQRLMHAFPRRIALLHSELTERERLHEWRAVRRGERDIVIGARSALFAPVVNRGVIVIDEESESAYKQQQRPRYHARDVARRMAKLEGSVLILGSATPSIESFHAAKKGAYKLLELPSRVVGGALPEVRIVSPEIIKPDDDDSNNTVNVDGREIPLTLMGSELREELKLTLSMKRQALLLLNLRGFAQSVICPKCGWVPRCPNCEVSLTYHRRTHTQVCHHCAHVEPKTTTCARCNYPKLKFLGWGTERLEAEVCELFPSAKFLRMDRDSVSTRGRRRRIVDAVRNHDVDILLGTQMIAKGLDFPSVRLVGVISADQSLHVPDFRAAERTFQLLTQVIGRAGRSSAVESEGGGIAIIQSYDPLNRVIKSACSQDFDSFYANEIILREKFLYPPSVHLARVVFSGKLKDTVEKVADDYGEALQRTREGDDLSVLGPSPAPLAKLEGKFRYHCIIKAPRVSKIVPWIMDAWRLIRAPKNIKIDIDIDPMSML